MKKTSDLALKERIEKKKSKVGFSPCFRARANLSSQKQDWRVFRKHVWANNYSRAGKVIRTTFKWKGG